MGDLQSALAGLSTGGRRRRRGSGLKRRGSGLKKKGSAGKIKRKVPAAASQRRASGKGKKGKGSGKGKGKKGKGSGKGKGKKTSPGKTGFKALLRSQRDAVAGAYYSSGDESQEWSPGGGSDSS